jgi:hypothetical protein
MKERTMTTTDTVTPTATITTPETTQPAERQSPWARVNHLVDESGERLELNTTGDVLEATGLDFTVSKRPMRRRALDGTWLESKRVSVVRDDTEEEVDVVSQDYGVFQFTEAFEFLNHIPGREFVAAGPLKDSRQAFMVVRLPDLAGFETIMSLWANADTVGFHGTGWGLVNAVSDYYEHGRRGGTDQSRLLGALEGQTRSILDRTVPFILGRFGK